MGLYFCKPTLPEHLEEPLYSTLPVLPPEREVWNQLEAVARASTSKSWNRSDEELAKEALECLVILHKFYGQSIFYMLSICQSNPLIQGALHFYPKPTPSGHLSVTKESPYNHAYVMDVFFGTPEEWKAYQPEVLGIHSQVDLQAKIFKAGFSSTLMSETRYRVP